MAARQQQRDQQQHGDQEQQQGDRQHQRDQQQHGDQQHGDQHHQGRLGGPVTFGDLLVEHMEQNPGSSNDAAVLLAIMERANLSRLVRGERSDGSER